MKQAGVTTKETEGSQNSTASVGYRAAWLFCLGVCFCHLISLPLLVNFDSNWYVRLSDVLGTNLFPVEWDFLRTPIFPAMLKFSFWLWGRQVMAIFGLQCCLACAGIWLLARSLRMLGLTGESVVAVAVLGAFPTLIAYQHMLLTEVGSFFFFSLIVCLLARPVEATLKGAWVLALALGLGYYYRSSLIYLAPLVGAIYVMSALREEWKRPSRNLRRHLIRLSLPQFLVVAVVPFLLAYPWQRNPKVTMRNGDVLFYGLVTQGVLPLNDPILGSAAPAYANEIEHSKSNGAFPIAGIGDGSQYSVLTSLEKYDPIANSIFLRIVWTDPAKYLKAVGRNLVMFLGLRGFSYDNALYVKRVLFSTESHIDPGGSWMTPLGKEFSRTSAPNFTSFALQEISPLYDWLVEFGLMATAGGLLLGVWRLDKTILAFTAPVIGFVAMHALLLVSQDRMIFPVQPIFVLNLIMFPAWLGLPTRIGIRLQTYRALVAGKTNLVSKNVLAGTVVGALTLGFLAAWMLRTSRQTRPDGIPATELVDDLIGFIDRVNGAAPGQLGNESHPLLIKAGESVVVEGWLAKGESSAASALDEVEGVLNGKAVVAQIVQRPDVADRFHNAKMGNSGFRVQFESRMLPGGTARIDLIGRKGDGSFHRFRQPIYVLSQ